MWVTSRAGKAAAGILFCFLADLGAGAERRGLFDAAQRPAAAVPKPAAAAPPVAVAAVRSRSVRLDMSQLAAWAAPAAAQTEPPAARKTLTLNLFDDAHFEAIVERRVPVLSGYMLRGRLDGVPRGRWTLVVRDSAATGTVLTDRKAYVLDAGAGGRHTLTEVSRSLFPPDDPDEPWRVRLPPDPPGALPNRTQQQAPYRPAPPSPANTLPSHGAGADLPAAGGRWLPIGPAPIVEGQVENVSPNNEVSGAIHTLLAHPTDADVLYVGAVNGGIWRTNNGTTSRPDWHPLTDDFHSLSIGAMAFDPNDPNTILAGIGRYSSFAQAGGDRVGVLLSKDGGNTWTHPNLPFGDPSSKNISGVAVDGDRLVASAGPFCCTSVYRSLDGGATWSEAEGLPADGVMDMVVDPTDRDRFYATVRERGVFRSDDGGVSWQDISSHDAMLDAVFTVPVFDEEGFEGRNNNAEMALASTGRLYVAVLVAGQAKYIGFTDDQGATWTAMDLPLTPEADGSELGLNPRFKPGGQGAIHFSIRVDPADPNIVYVGGDRQDFGCADMTYSDTCSSFIGATDFTGRLFRGDAATAPTSEVPSPQWQHLTHRSDIEAIPGGGTANGSAPHADSREMVFDANGDIIEVDDGGIYRRTSPGDNSGDWFSLNGNLQVSEMHSVAYDPLAEVVIGGTQDNSTAQQLSANDTAWAMIGSGDGGDVAVDSSNAPDYSIRYSSSQFLLGFLRAHYDGANTAIDSQQPALELNGVPVYETNPGFHFLQPVILNAVDPRRAVLPAASIYETDDRFDTLTESYAFDRSIAESANAAAYGCSANPDLLYIGYGDLSGAAVVSVRTELGSDETATPDDFKITPYPGALPRDILINPDDCATVYVADDSEVYASYDTGATWRRITGNLADVPVFWRDLQSLEFVPGGGPLGAAAVLVAGRGGVHAMYTAQERMWLAVNEGLPNAPAADLDYDATHDVLVVSTLGRGAWRLQRGPVIVRQIENMRTEVGAGELIVSLAGVFEDLAGGRLTYSVESTDETIATVRINGDVMRVVPRAAGVAAITVTARDAGGGSTAGAFTVTVGAVLNLAASASTREGATARLTVTLSRPVRESIELAYALGMDDNRNTSDADAEDYAQAHGTTVIEAGATTGTIEIAIEDDDLVEPLREVFAVRLTAPARNPHFGLGLETTSTVTIHEGVCDRTEPLRDTVVGILGAATCAAVDDLTSIVALDLSGRGIGRLKSFDFLDMSALAHLDLSRNALTELSYDAFAGPYRLQTLALRSNQLTVLPDHVFEFLPELRQLHLSGNRLTALPSELFLSNRLLAELRLDHNALASLPIGIFNSLHMLRVLQLQNNPGAPFALVVDLARTDAEPWQPSSPATVVARIAQGGPFDVDIKLTVAGGGLSTETVRLATGDSASNPFNVAQIDARAAEVGVRTPPLPSANYAGFTIVAGDPLLLFKARPTALLVPRQQTLEADGEVIVFHLATLLVDFDSEQLTYTATSSDKSVATARIDGALLTITSVEDGTTTITVAATDSDGLRGTLAIELVVSPSARFLRSWRLILFDRD